jgi:hypothetical protein
MFMLVHTSTNAAYDTLNYQCAWAIYLPLSYIYNFLSPLDDTVTHTFFICCANPYLNT